MFASPVNAFEQIRGKTNFTFDDLGEKKLKNIERPVRLYAVRGATSACDNDATVSDFVNVVRRIG